MVATQGTWENIPYLFSQHSSHCHRGLCWSSFWRELAGMFAAWNICGNAYASWNPLESFQGLVGENRAFHQMQSRSPPPPLLESGSWCWERLVSSGVSPGLAPCLPSSHPSLTEKACKLSRRENLFRILTFSSVLRPLEAQF